MKKRIALLLSATFFLFSATAFASDSVTVFLDDAKIEAEGVIIDGRTYLPVRALSEAMGAQVDWNGETKTVSVTTKRTSEDIISELSESVVAIVGNYKPKYVSDTVYKYNSMTAHGTGVVIKSGGMILTNAHVVEEIENLTVVFHDGSCYGGIVKYIDTVSDLAVVQVDRLGLKSVKFAQSSSIKSGQEVIAIGNPLSLSLRNTATKGIVSGIDVIISGEYYPFLQSDAPINGGNSGGPLVNMQGEVVGINTMKYTGLGIEGMSFAISVDTINYVLKQFETNGKVVRAELGVSLSESWEAQIGLPTTKGVTVSASDRMELRAGDEIVKINSIPVHSIVQCNKVLRDTYTTGAITVRVKRGANEIDITLTPVLK